jgi:ribose transport system ATP-binding protein
MGFLTEDRRAEGLLMASGVEDNLALASWPRFGPGPLGWIRAAQVRVETRRTSDSLALRCHDTATQPVMTLSGGSQQKVVLGRWLLAGCGVLILDEPTRGVDIAARRDIYSEINRLLEGGAGVLMISSELEELIGMCDRILVLSRGAIVSEFGRADFDQSAILRAAFGGERLQ